MIRKQLLVIPLILTICSSCGEKPLSIYEEFAKKYIQFHPAGFNAEPNWYEYERISIRYSFDFKEKIIRTTKLDGFIDFEKDSFDGTTTAFEMSSETIVINENQIESSVSFATSLSNNNYYEIEKNQTLTVSKGCGNIPKLYLESQFDNDFYSVKGYQLMLDMNFLYESINIYENHVTFNRVLPLGDFGRINTKTEYYFDNEYEIFEIIQYKDIFYDEDDAWVIQNNYMNYSSYTRLIKGIEKHINVPTSYDEEYIYDEKNPLFLFL